MRRNNLLTSILTLTISMTTLIANVITLSTLSNMNGMYVSQSAMTPEDYATSIEQEYVVLTLYNKDGSTHKKIEYIIDDWWYSSLSDGTGYYTFYYNNDYGCVVKDDSNGIVKYKENINDNKLTAHNGKYHIDIVKKDT